MPIYTYVCGNCGYKFDVFTHIVNGSEKPKCEKCSSKNTKKILAGFSVGKSPKGGSSSSCPTGTCPLG